jgi:hypothetical protein
LKEGFSEGISKEDVEEWSKSGGEVMKGFEEEFMKVEKEGERVGWMKVCSDLLSIMSSSLQYSPLIYLASMDKILTNSDSVSRHLQIPIIEI